MNKTPFLLTLENSFFFFFHFCYFSLKFTDCVTFKHTDIYKMPGCFWVLIPESVSCIGWSDWLCLMYRINETALRSLNKFNICVSFFTAATTPGPAFVTWTWSPCTSHSTPLRLAASSNPPHWQQCWPSSTVQCTGGAVTPPNQGWKKAPW